MAATLYQFSVYGHSAVQLLVWHLMGSEHSIYGSFKTMDTTVVHLVGCSGLRLQGLAPTWRAGTRRTRKRRTPRRWGREGGCSRCKDVGQMPEARVAQIISVDFGTSSRDVAKWVDIWQSRGVFSWPKSSSMTSLGIVWPASSPKTWGLQRLVDKFHS